jgi:endonuclease YncB( thermonuclease family)
MIPDGAGPASAFHDQKCGVPSVSNPAISRLTPVECRPALSTRDIRNGLHDKPIDGRRTAAYRIAAVVSALVWTLAVPPSVGADPAAATALVLKVVDGDTIDIRDDVRGRLRVRLLGIDSPETNKPGYTVVGCWGPEATEFAKSTMLDQRVALVPDPTHDRTDRYGRTLAYLVRADGRDYSVEAARAGAARSYICGGRPVGRHDAIATAEREARDARRGLWGPPCNGNMSSVAGVTVADAAPPLPASSPAPPPAFLEPPAGTVPPLSSGVYYGDCGDARAAGDAPLRVGEPGYRSGLDRDGDGVACES